jgi:hypothetical protein
MRSRAKSELFARMKGSAEEYHPRRFSFLSVGVLCGRAVRQAVSCSMALVG